VVWLFHQHRAAYDGAGSEWSDFGDDDASRDAQRLLAQWDAVALGEATRRFTTSGVVAARLARFNGLSATPLYHPEPHAELLRPGPFGDYLFCPTRLESNKRPGLMVDALPRLDPAVSVRLAGKGSLTDQLAGAASRAGTTDRLDLLGFVPDDRLVDLYSGALAVVYAPFDEDYGYVTLQAFRAGKPVITASDSGGILEWVEDGVTGFVTDPTPEAIAEAANRLHRDRALAEKLGAAGRERVASLSWETVVRTLVGDE
jgi:glycosyltransferase involved in cell wall biosynthesis